MVKINSNMKRSLLKIIIPSIVGAVIVGGIVYKSVAKPNVSYETEKIERGTVVQDVSVTGSIASMAKVTLQPEISGKVAEVKVKEGDEVKAGDLLLSIETGDIDAKIAGQRATVSSALARLKELEAGATKEELALTEKAIETAQSRLDAAISAEMQSMIALSNAKQSQADIVARDEASIDAKIEVLTGDLDDAVAAANDAVNRLSKDLFNNLDQLTFTSSNPTAASEAVNTRGPAKQSLSAMTSAAASAKTAVTVNQVIAAAQAASNGLLVVKAHLDADLSVLRYDSTLSATLVSTYQLNLNAAVTAVNAASQALAASISSVTVQQKTNDANLTTASTAVDSAQAALSSAGFAVDAAKKSLAQAQADLNLKKAGARQEVVAAQRATVQFQQSTLDGLMAELAKRRIVAPLDGIVISVNLEKGETASPATPAVIISGLGKFEITTNISEVDIAKIKVGDPVRITLDAFPENEAWTGKVITIQPAEKVLEGIIFYETKVVFDNDDQRLKSGMTANLEIETARKEGVLRLPLRALKEQRGRKYVELLKGDMAVETDVTLGLENNEYTEAVSGVAEGDLVIVATKTN